jgi:hypothetical protein
MNGSNNLDEKAFETFKITRDRAMAMLKDEFEQVDDDINALIAKWQKAIDEGKNIRGKTLSAEERTDFKSMLNDAKNYYEQSKALLFSDASKSWELRQRVIDKILNLYIYSINDGIFFEKYKAKFQ